MAPHARNPTARPRASEKAGRRQCNPVGYVGPERAPRMRVLCVDDNQACLRLVAEVLRRGGCEVECAANGQEAAALATAQQFDAVVTDHDMPVMNGVALVEHLRRAAFAGRIVVISAGVGAAEQNAYRAHGIAEILLKPVEGPRLVSAVQGLPA